MLRRELLQQKKVVILAKLPAQQFQFVRECARFRRPGRIKQTEIMPEVFDVLPPVVKIFRRRLPAGEPASFAPATITLLQSRLDRRPARRLDFQIAHAPVRLAQKPFRRLSGIVLPKPLALPAAQFFLNALSIPANRRAPRPASFSNALSITRASRGAVRESAASRNAFAPLR